MIWVRVRVIITSLSLRVVGLSRAQHLEARRVCVGFAWGLRGVNQCMASHNVLGLAWGTRRVLRVVRVGTSIGS